MSAPNPVAKLIADALAALDAGEIPPSREASLAKTKLQEAQFWAEQSTKKRI